MSIKITPQAPQGTTPDANRPRSDVPARLRITAILLYAIFIGILLAVTMRVSSPQSESIWSIYETPGDLIRLALGFGVCLWILFHLFMLPKDAEGYRTWIYLGVIVIPFALALAFAVW
jgi:TRAP-type C4-dicarboxylate transport system permease small subunit